RLYRFRHTLVVLFHVDFFSLEHTSLDTRFTQILDQRLGDDIRRIDWNLYSRFEKYFLKLFTDERQMQVQIFLDCSASMGKDNPEKFNYAIATAAALGFLTVQNMDKLSFQLMKGNKAENPYGTLIGKNAFFRAIGDLEKLNFEDEVDIEACVKSCADTSSKNGLTVIISDFLTESDWKKAVDYLCYKKRQVLLVQLLTREELNPAYDGRMNLVDAESLDMADNRNMKLRITRSMLQAYEEALQDFKKDIKTFCSKRDVDYISVATDMPIEKVLFNELLKAGIME
ncbi:MAG: DUF58 domain-containing protein, partial [Clostridia bacterium]|nr:DUF58 domain-containing protein [Clostridia bacterium]